MGLMNMNDLKNRERQSPQNVIQLLACCTTALTLLLLSTPSTLHAEPPSEIVAFGTSFLVNRQSASEPSWIEYLAIDLGVPLDNRAVGGAGIPGTFQQLEEYLAEHTPSPSSLFVLAPGSTPYFCEPPCAPTPADIDHDKIEQEEGRMMERLVDAGARMFLIPEATIGFVPRAETVWPGQRSLWIEIMTDYNTKQRARMDAISESTSATFISPGWFELFQTMSDKPQELGFAEGRSPGNSSRFPEQHFTWDGVHQTSAVHRLLADDALLDILSEIDRPTKQLSARGGSLKEDFDAAMGLDPRGTGQPLPGGWSVTGDRRLTFSNHVTRPFVVRGGRLSDRMLGDGDVFNAGKVGDADRALVTSISRSGVGSEIDLHVEFAEGTPKALRMTFDLEMWGMDDRIREPGTAAFDVKIEALSGGEFLGLVATDRVALDVSPSTRVDGNAPAFRVAHDSGVIDVRDQNLDALAIRWTTVANLGAEGWAYGLDNFQLTTAREGDANVDGKVNFADFLILSDNFGHDEATWEDGDFDADGTVLFSDFLLLSDNFGNSSDGVSAVPEPSYSVAIVLIIVAVAGHHARSSAADRHQRVGHRNQSRRVLLKCRSASDTTKIFRSHS